MWIAYYNHKFLSLFVLLFRLSYSHFHPNPFTTVSGAYHTARAAMVFRMTRGNEDRQKILKHLTKFARLHPIVVSEILRDLELLAVVKD